MRAHALLNGLYELRNRDKMRSFDLHFIFFVKFVMGFINSIIQECKC